MKDKSFSKTIQYFSRNFQKVKSIMKYAKLPNHVTSSRFFRSSKSRQEYDKLLYVITGD